jgi:hypothetical protein
MQSTTLWHVLDQGMPHDKKIIKQLIEKLCADCA